MEVTLLGISIEVRLLQPEKAYLPMEVTLLGIIVFLQPAINVFVAVSMMALQSLRESYFVLPLSTLMEVRQLQPENADPSMDITLLGISIEVKLLQPQKAVPSKDVTLLGIIVFLQPAIKVFVAVSMIALQSLRESYFVLPLSTLMEVRPIQP